MIAEDIKRYVDSILTNKQINIEQLCAFFGIEASSLTLIKENKYFSFYNISGLEVGGIGEIEIRKPKNHMSIHMVIIKLLRVNVGIKDLVDVARYKLLEFNVVPNAGITHDVYIVNDKKISFERKNGNYDVQGITIIFGE